MADRLRVPFAKPPARHRMPSRWQWWGTHHHVYDPLEAKPYGELGRRVLGRVYMVVAAAAGTTLLSALVVPEMRRWSAPDDIPSEAQRYAYVTERYESCRILQVLTGATGKRASKLRVDWDLRPNEVANHLLQTYADTPGVSFGPAVPVVRMFNLDSSGQPVLSREIGRTNIDTNGRANPDHFYAELPRPYGATRYALSVRNSVTIQTARDARQTEYGEQQCGELTWSKPPGSSTYQWGYKPPHPALVVLDRHAVIPPNPAPPQRGG